MLFSKKPLPRLITYFIVFTAMMLQTQLALAGRCPYDCDKGALCFSDWANGYSCGKFHGTNSNWGIYGWANRADGFYNYGYSHKACIYKRSTTGRIGRLVYGNILAIGDYVKYPRNVVVANSWTLTNCSNYY